ncbi:hypothetical protein NC651_000648 [Populus alba x Populus x berolinensis]|nr:hypothetical protein NC651_000648 [Populus alba x Populus x berolinensis]
MPQNTCFSYSICTYHTASCFASLYKITNTVFFVVEDDPKGDPPCRYKSHHHSSLLQSASNTINPKKSNMHLLKELMEIGYLYTGVSFWIIHYLMLSAQHSTVGRDYANQTIPGRTQAAQTRSSHHKINHKLIFHDKVQRFKLYNAGFIEQAGVLSYEQGVSEASNSGSFWWSFVSECYLGQYRVFKTSNGVT